MLISSFFLTSDGGLSNVNGASMKQEKGDRARCMFCRKWFPIDDFMEHNDQCEQDLIRRGHFFSYDT